MRALALLLAMACNEPAPQKHKAKPIEIETPLVKKALDADDADPAWLAGTWKKDGENHWFLFNLPDEVAELSGKPPRVVRRGKLALHGAFVDAIFDREELHFEASPDRGELRADGTYRRGAPP